MHLLENSYEKKLLLELPPHARDIAENFLATKSLGNLLQLIERNSPDELLLAKKKVPIQYWIDILKAAALAKTTYFLPNEKLSREELLFLIKSACLSVDIPTQDIVLRDVIEFAKLQEMNTLHQWLKSISSLLVKNIQEK